MTNRGKTIQARLILLLVVALVPVIGIQTYMYYAAFQERKAAQFEGNLEIARAIAKSFDTFVSNVVRQELSIGLAITSSPKLSTEDSNRLLLKTQKDNPALWEIFWVSPTGVVLSATGPQFLGMNLGDREYFRKIVAGQEYVISDLLLSRTTQQPSFTISRGIRDEKGVLLGIVAIGILPERLNQLLGVERFKGGGFAVVDSKGMLVFRYPAIKATWEERNWLKQFPQFGDTLKGKEVSATVYAAFEGKNRMVSFTPIPSIGWAASAGQREEDLTGPVLASIARNAVIIGLILTAAFFLALALSRRIAKPVADLRQYALALGRGEGRKSLPAQSISEFKDLADAFDTMAEKVRAREEALGRSEERFRVAQELSPDGFTIFQPVRDNKGEIFDFKWVYENDAIARMNGTDPKMVVGRRLSEFMPGHAASAFHGLYKRVAETGTPGVLEAPYEGDTIATLTWFRVVTVPMGEYIAILSQDITEHKRAEKALQQAHDELERRVEERTAELRQAYDKLTEETREREQIEVQLRQSQKMEALGTMAGGIAHDFNNIIAAIIGFTELLGGQVAKGSRGERHVKRIMEGSIRARELVRQMLTFSRKSDQEKKPLSLSSVVKETATLIRATTPSTVDIRVADTVNDSGFVLGESTQVQQVLMNLCSNAVHAMREKGGTLDVQLSDHTVSPSNGDPHGIDPGQYVRLTVRDTGIGMPPHIMDKIFDPFFTTKKLGEGTGLGLSVVHGIVKHSNGYITVESEPDKGSTFTVYLPKIAGDLEIDQAVDDGLATGSERILFVDDEEALVEMSEDILAELGYDVTSQLNSREALALLKEDPSRFDLVITDQTMPEMTGVEFAKEILTLRADMPIIMCTGFSHLVNEKSAREAGIRAFAMKPLTKREIARTVRAVLDK